MFVSYVYVNYSMHMGEDFWDILVTFIDSHDQPWIMEGDFNVVQSILVISTGHA